MAVSVDANGIVTEGRFQGRPLAEVLQYAEGLEEVVTTAGRTVPENAPPKPETKEPTAAEKLAAASAHRIDPLMQSTLARFEADDEEAFAKTVSDYDKYKAEIDKQKQTLLPQVRAQKGVHRTLYIHIKSQDEGVRKRIFEPLGDPPKEETTEEKAAREAKEKKEKDDAAAKLAAEEAAKRGPKPAPPFARPTPASRTQAQPKEGDKKTTLVATAKITEFCRKTGQNVEQYLLRLEGQGVTQADLDHAGQLGKRAEDRTHAYNRPRATRTS